MEIACRCCRRRQGYDNTSTFSLKTAELMTKQMAKSLLLTPGPTHAPDPAAHIISNATEIS